MTSDNFYKRIAYSIFKGERTFHYWGKDYTVEPSGKKNGKGDDIYYLYVTMSDGTKSLERSIAINEAKLRKWTE